jgi:hypothetical protein
MSEIYPSDQDDNSNAVHTSTKISYWRFYEELLKVSQRYQHT